MSISRRASSAARILGVSAGALTIAAFGAAQTASACDLRNSHQPHQDGQGHNYSTCTFSIDGGQHFYDASKLPAFSTPGNTVTVLVQGSRWHDCDVSLAAYKANGPTWETSGEQTLLSWDSTVQEHADSDHIYSLSVSIPADVCFAQVDLYKGHEKYDGHDADHPAPNGPSRPVIGTNLLKAWNGATNNCQDQGGNGGGTPSGSASPSASASESASASASASPSDSPSDSGSPAPSDSASAPASGSASASASVSASGSAAPSESGSTVASASASVVASGSASTTVEATSSNGTSGGGLASTGSDGTGTMAAIGAALVALGAGAVYMVRRKRAPRH